jgi:hypothetical protein
MAWVVIAGTTLAFAVFGRKAVGTGAFEMVTVTLGVLTLGFATAALIAETMWALLVPAMAGLVLMRSVIAYPLRVRPGAQVFQWFPHDQEPPAGAQRPVRRRARR